MGHTDSGRQVNGGFERKGEGRGEVVEVRRRTEGRGWSGGDVEMGRGESVIE